MSTNLKLTDGKRDQILKYLGDGHPNSVVAGAAGVSESYISQLLADENFVLEVSKLRLAKLSKHTDQDNLYDEIEEILSKKLKGLLDYVMDPMKVVRILSEMNKMKRRNQSTTDGLSTQTNIIQLQLPPAIVNKLKIEVNINSQVTKIGEHSMTTASINNLNNLLDKMKTARTIEMEQQNGQNQNPLRLPGA